MTWSINFIIIVIITITILNLQTCSQHVDSHDLFIIIVAHVIWELE